MTGLDWQDIDPDAYDPDNPLASAGKGGATEETERAMAAVRAVRSMIAAGADAGVMAVARDFVKRTKVLAVASFDNLVHEARGEDGGTGEPERKSVATALVDLAQELYTFGVSDLGEPFAIPIDGPRVVAMLRGGKTSLRALLAREYFTRTGKAATQQALADALLVIEGMAQERGRVARCTCGPRSTTARSGSTSATTPAGPSGSPAPGGRSRTPRRCCSSGRR